MQHTGISWAIYLKNQSGLMIETDTIVTAINSSNNKRFFHKSVSSTMAALIDLCLVQRKISLTTGTKSKKKGKMK